METSQRDYLNNPLHSASQNQGFLTQESNFFAFLEDGKETSTRPPSFFSKNGLGQDIIQVTGAEPDICLEVFYALYNILWPQIEKQSNASLKDAWITFIDGSVIKGSLCPPEKLLTERRVREIKNIFCTQGGEARTFQYLDQVMMSISYLEQKIVDYPGQILQKEEIIASLNLVEQFYLEFRYKVKALVRTILEKEQMNIAYGSETDALEKLLEPKATMMSDAFSQHWAYRIPRNEAEKILSLDTHGRNIQSSLNDPSKHRVVALPENVSEPLVSFKANGNPSIQSEKEFMLWSLYRHLQIPVPETALLVLTNVFEANPDYFYAVQASEFVIGESPLRVYQDQEIIFDQQAYASQVIGTLLTNPSNGSFENFKYSSKHQTFISIDNGLVFEPEIVGSDDKRVINVKSILYLLPQIDQLMPKSAKTSFTTLDHHLTILSWLHDLAQKNKEYNLLLARLAFQKMSADKNLPRGEAFSLASCLQEKILVNRGLANESYFYPQILVSEGLLSLLVEKLQRLEKLLLNNPSISFQKLFEEISPLLAKYYRKLRLEFNDLGVALNALEGEKKNDVDYSLVSSLLDHDEIYNLASNHSLSKFENEATPETFFEEYKSLLASGENPLDRFIQRHHRRKKENALNLQEALRELQLLVQEKLTDSKCIPDIVDFCHSLSQMTDVDSPLCKDIIFLLSNLPHSELKWLLALEKYFLRADSPIPKDLIPYSLDVDGSLMKQRIFVLTESESRYLFDRQLNVKGNPSLTGRSLVTYFPENQPEFYLKQFPECPGYEFASILFMRSLGIQHLPYQDLLIIDFEYPALLSQKVSGNPVHCVWNDPQAFQNLDPFHTGLLIISAILLNPEDGKEDNFILSEDGKYLIPIDNDHCFLPSFVQKGKFWNFFTVNTALQTKTLLFSLDEMDKPLPVEVCKHILSIDFDCLLPQWMTELGKLEDKFNNLCDSNQRHRFLKQGTLMKIPFYEQFLHNLHWKAHKIQHILNTVSQPTPFDLLKAVEPFAARCYEDSFNQGDTLQARFKAATDQLYKKTTVAGSRVSILNTRAMMEIINIPEKDLQEDAAFQRMGPVDALKLLNQLIEERDERIQREQELLYELDEKSEEKKWTSLFGNPPAKTALKAFFEYPKEGLALKGSKLLTSKKLIELFTQAPDKGMRIRFLSLTDSPVLSNEEIRLLTTECPNIEYLNVSGCVNLEKISTPEGKWPLLSRLEARGCEKLVKFSSYSPIKILRIGTATNSPIKIFVERFTLDILNISTKSNQFEFSLRKEESFEVKFRGRSISQDNFIQAMFDKKEEAEKCFRDVSIKIGKYSISSARDLEIFLTFINLEDSNIEADFIQRMIRLKLPNLKNLNLSKNKIGSTDIQILARGNWPLLETLDLKGIGLTKKELLNFLLNINWPNLRKINLDYDENSFVESLLPKNWPLLQKLDLSSCEITQKEIKLIAEKSRWPHLKYLNLSNNAEIDGKALETLSQGNWPSLEALNLSYCKITQKEIELIVEKFNWPQLKHLNLSGSKINDKALGTLSRGNWPLLETLSLKSTKVTENSSFEFALGINWPNFKFGEYDWGENKGHSNSLDKTLLSLTNWIKAEVELRKV